MNRAQRRKDKSVTRKLAGKTSLYRHYDKDGKLLYVGISYKPMDRTMQHEYSARWFDLVAMIDVEPFETRASALKAEAVAIHKEMPVYNIVKPEVSFPDLVLSSLSLTPAEKRLLPLFKLISDTVKHKAGGVYRLIERDYWIEDYSDGYDLQKRMDEGMTWRQAVMQSRLDDDHELEAERLGVSSIDIIDALLAGCKNTYQCEDEMLT